MRLALRIIAGFFLVAGLFLFLYSSINAAEAVEAGRQRVEVGDDIEVVIEPERANADAALYYSTAAFVLGGSLLLVSFAVRR